MSVKKNMNASSNEGVDIDIEYDVPFPARQSEYIKNWNIEQMKEGGSFFVALDDEQKEGSMRHALKSYCNRIGRELNRNLKFAKDHKKGKEGFRIYRLKGGYVQPVSRPRKEQNEGSQKKAA